MSKQYLETLIKKSYGESELPLSINELEERGWKVRDIDEAVELQLIVPYYVKSRLGLGHQLYWTVEQEQYHRRLCESLAVFGKQHLEGVIKASIDYYGAEGEEYFGCITCYSASPDGLSDISTHFKNNQIWILGASPDRDDRSALGDQYIEVCMTAPKERFMALLENTDPVVPATPSTR